MRERERKAKKFYTCPEPGYVRDENIRRVGVYTGDGFDHAERMLKRTPSKFYRLLGWADAKNEAEPIQQQVAQAKAKQKAASDKAAAKSLKQR